VNWLLLRGWTRESRHWGAFPAHLGAALPGARIVAADLPGTGARNAEASPARVAEITDAVRREHGPGPWRLLGLSLGAMVCADWASRHPGEVQACVLVNTSLRPFSPFWQRLRPAAWAGVLGLWFQPDALRREAGVLALTSATAGAEVARAWADFATERPVSRRNALRQILAAARYRAPEQAPGVPLLVLASAADRLVDPACSKELSRRWRTPLALHPSAGHDLPLDDPAWIAAQMRGWLGGLAQP
jgi:pimeloyl-ACP methyl ester carboxylesterase